MVAAPAETFRPLIDAFVREHCVDNSTERPEMIYSMMENERYWQGHHYYTRRLRGNQVYWESINTVTNRLERENNPHVYDTVLNYYYGEGLRLVGVLGNAPNAKAIADVRNDINSRRVRIADQIISGLWPHWNVEALQSELVHSLWKNGTSFLYTPFVPNAKRFGQSHQPVWELKTTQVLPDTAKCAGCGMEYPGEAIGHMCAQCGMKMGPEALIPGESVEFPVVSGYISFDNGTVECHLTSAYSVSTPFHIKHLDDSPWLAYAREESYGKIIRAFPEWRGKLDVLRSGGTVGGGAASDTVATEARSRAMNPNTGISQDRRRHVGELKTLWIEPDQYELLNTGRMENAFRELLYREYENGLRLTLCNGLPLHMFAESHKECWSAVKPTVSEYLYAKPLGDPWVKLNRAVNNAYNIMHQTAESSVPVTLYDTNILSDGVFERNPASVANYIGCLPGSGHELRQSVHTVEPAELTQAVVNIGPATIQAGRDITNMPPELTGAGAPTTTLGEAELKYNAAIRPHNTTWNMIRGGWGRAYTNAIMLFARHSMDKVHFNSPNGQQTQSIVFDRLSELLDGGWHVEMDQEIPATAGQKRAMVLQLFQMNPQAVSQLPIFDAENLGPLYDYLGLGDIKIPLQAQREKIIDEINELLQGQPVQNPDGSLAPSIPPDEFLDDHQLWVAVGKQWLAEDSGREQRRVNPGGYENVRARVRLHLQIVNMMAAPPQGAPPPQQGGAPPPPPESAGDSMGPDRPPQPPAMPGQGVMF